MKTLKILGFFILFILIGFVFWKLFWYGVLLFIGAVLFFVGKYSIKVNKWYNSKINKK